MGIETIALASLAVGAVGTAASYMQGQKQKKAQGKIKEETAAQNASKQMEERRQQVREERVKRARILQASENTGVSESSGEVGAIGSMATQLGVNIGSNLGAIQSANRIGEFAQDAASAGVNASNYSAIGKLGQSAVSTIFSPTPVGGLPAPAQQTPFDQSIYQTIRDQ